MDKKCIFDWNQIMNWELVLILENGLSKPELANEAAFKIRFQKTTIPICIITIKEDYFRIP
jgi:hypothetical protein